jgi:predicted enzyme related to lactoylglutathione lyase
VARVTGIGGVFFRARDPEALRAWYAEHLGIELEEWGGAVFQAREGDQTVWYPTELSPDYHGSGELGVMLNYRVDDLDALLAQLRTAGLEVLDRVSDEENGRFGWAVDPEGNRFELWEPRG